MRRVLISVLVLICWIGPVAAQEDDKGFLTRTLEELLTDAGREVRIEGFRGALSSQASMTRMTIADDAGVWLTLNDVVLDWNRAALLRGRLEIDALTAASLDIPRLPVASDDKLPAAEAQGFALPELPVSIDIKTFAINQIALGAPILGQATRMSLRATAQLEEGSGAVVLSALRTDGQAGAFEVDAGYDKADRQLRIKLDLTEDPDGIVTQLLNLPGAPSVSLQVTGDAPVDDFTAAIKLSTDGVPRVSGAVELRGAAPQDGPVTQQITADLTGDIAPLFAPQYAEFFGTDARLELNAQRQPGGAVKVERFTINSKALRLEGEVRLNSDLWPVLLRVDGRVAALSGGPVLLPFAQVPTRVTAADLMIRHDARQSEDWQAQFDLKGLAREDIAVDDLRLGVSGTLQGNLNSVGQILGDLTFLAKGVTLADPSMSAALGSAVQGSAKLNYIEGQPLRISDLILEGADYGVQGMAIIGSLESGFNTRLQMGLRAGDLTRFAGLAGRAIAGSALVDVAGTLSPLAGTFDLKVTGQGTDLSVDQERADRVLQGRVDLTIEAARTTQGTDVPVVKINGDHVAFDGAATLRTDASTLRYDARLRDVGRVAPGVPGPLTVIGTATQSKDGWRIDADASGPYAARVSVAGLATGPNAALSFDGTLPDIGVFVLQINGALAATGKLSRVGDGWQADVSAQGPAGSNAQLVGLISDTGQLDMTLQGTAPLGLSAPFLRPRVLQGQARFDMALRGPPRLSSLSGQITTTDARFSAPALRFALRDIGSTVTLQQGQALIEAAGNVSTGGRLTANGTVALTAPFLSRLTARLTGVGYVDPTLFRTTVDGAVDVNGPLQNGATISGTLNVGETEITIPASGLTTIGDIPAITHIGASPAVRATQSRAGLGPQSTETGTRQTAYPLNLTINAPQRIFVRGRGVDAELGGQLRLTGDTANVISAGRFDLVRGRLDILGQRFVLDEGAIQMQGALIPFIRFVSTTQTDTGSASIIVEGPADRPSVTFSSSPEAPEDEVLSQLLFGRDLSQISAFQALKLANAVATLAGKGGVGLIGKLRQGFGLDDLDITSRDDGTTAVRAGKYISDNVYTDITAGSDGTGDVSLNIDLSPSITARGSVGSDGNSGIGLFFEKDY